MAVLLNNTESPDNEPELLIKEGGGCRRRKSQGRGKVIGLESGCQGCLDVQRRKRKRGEEEEEETTAGFQLLVEFPHLLLLTGRKCTSSSSSFTSDSSVAGSRSPQTILIELRQPA